MEVTVDKEKLQTTMSREFNAPREKVWQAHADREAFAKWWGARNYKIEVVEWDFKVGGKWKTIHTNGNEKFVFFGEFKDVVEPDHFTWTFSVESFPSDPIEETMSMEELPDSRTRLTTVSHYPNIESLKGMIESGMEEGARETWDRLAELVES